jgi:osmoprotectant transport system ATP-binding protein
MLHLQHQLKKTILFVTHDVEEALRLADKIVIMRDGRLVQYDTPFNILKNPANDFVRDLVGADDMVRQLGLVRVEAVMEPLPPDFEQNGHATIDLDASLREALSVLLGANTAVLTVLNEEDTAVGILTLSSLQVSP